MLRACASVRVYMCFVFFILGKGLFGGSRRLRVKPV